MRECDEDDCWAMATPDGPAFQVGKPPGDITLMRRFTCAAGHRFWLDMFNNPEAMWSASVSPLKPWNT